MALEAWINNNVKFYSYDNVFMFVSRICAEERNYNTFDYIDPANKKNATQVYDYLATMFDFKITKEQEEKLKVMSIEEIIPMNINMSPVFRYFNIVVYPLTFLFAIKLI